MQNLHIQAFVEKLQAQNSALTPSRRVLLDKLAAAISGDLTKGKAIVKFICTHNSRRSQLAEFMLDVFARENGLNIIALSAGTVATAFEPRMVKAIMKQGFELMEYGHNPNPLYIHRIEMDDLYYYSKKYDDQLLDQGKSTIVTVCSEAEADCPVVPGTGTRIHIPYEDPKIHDNTDKEEEAYDNKVIEIGREMSYVIKQVSKSN